MTEEPISDQMSTVEPAAAENQPPANTSPVEEVQTSAPSLMDFSSPVEAAPPPNGGNGAGQAENIDMLMDVNLQFTVELGRTQMPVRQILELQNGSVVELDRIAGEAVDVFINEHLMARGEVVVVDDKFGVRITELISPTKGK